MTTIVSEDRNVLVFGATGQQGGAVARALRKAGWGVRAFVRDVDGMKARALAAIGCELFRGDLSDYASIEAATAGAYGVFSVQPSSGQGAAYGVSDAQEIAYGIAVADIAGAAGVRHFVYSSANAVGDRLTGVGHFDSKAEVERHLASLAMLVTVIRPSAFMEILTLPGLGLDQGTLTFFMRPDQAMQFIAVDDIGRIVAAILAEPERFAGQTLEIAGDAITGDDLTAKFSNAADRPIAYRRFAAEVLADNPFLASLAVLVDDGRLAGRANLDELRGIVPDLLTFDTWLAGPGRPLLNAALKAEAGTVALR